jgi:replicative DNA helicase
MTDVTTNGHVAVDDLADAGGRSLEQPPHDDDAERAVFGSILKNPASVRQIIDLVEARDFYTTRHQAIWKAVVALEEAGKPIDYHLLGDQLHQHGTYESSGGLLYLADINLATPTAAFIVHYARIVVRTAMHRRIISLSQGLAEAAWRDDKDPAALMEEMVRRMTKLTARAAEEDGMDWTAAGDNVMATLVEEREAFKQHDPSRGEYMAGWKTGLLDLDKVLLGMKAGDLIYLAARTSVGKSILAQQIAMNVANHNGPVYFASLEMSQSKLIHRAITMGTGVPRHELVRGNLSDTEYTAVQEFIEKKRRLPLRWDTTSRTVDQIRRRATRWQDEIGKPIALIVVDYVQLLRDQQSQRSNRYENVSLASHNLKDLAEALHCTVFAPAQVSREVLKRTSKMPDLSDLRESGDLEQDADVVLGLDRADYHARDGDDHTAQLAVLKARDLAADRGRGTLVHMAWLATYERYADLALPPDNVVPFRPPQQFLHDDLEAMLPEAETEAATEDPLGLPW